MTARRNPTLRLALIAPLLAGLAACGGKDGGSTGPDTEQPPATTIQLPPLRGADVSALARIEQAGGVFRDKGQAGDALAILRAHGSNLFRLRLFVNPNYQEVQVNDLPYTIALAKRVKATGAQLLLDIHYSDTWADPAHQTTPGAWAGLDMAGLEAQVESYTADAVRQLKAAGAEPDIVQIGNEIDAGMLWPLGQVGGGADNPTQWGQLSRLLKAAIRGARSAAAPDSIRILLQYSQGGSSSGTQWFFDKITANGVPYDIIGLSYYPWWHGTLSALAQNMTATAARYGKDIMVVETAYPWRAGGWEDMATNRTAMTWAISADGQSRFLRDIAGAVGALPNSRGRGVVWWYPEAIQVPGIFMWGGGSVALFDASGNVLPAASEFTAR